MDYIDKVLEIKAAAAANPFNPIHNPTGVLDMGGATNHLCADLLTNKVRSSFNYDSSMQHYFPWHGVDRVRRAAAAFITRMFRIPQNLSPENLVMVNGADIALETAVATLVQDHKQEGKEFCVLVPTPNYDALFRMFHPRLGLKVRTIPTDEHFQLETPNIIEVIQKVIAEGLTPLALVLVNPNNPLGDIATRKQVEDIATLCQDFNIDLVVDEVYGLSVHSGASFESALSSCSEHPHRERIHSGSSFESALSSCSDHPHRERIHSGASFESALSSCSDHPHRERIHVIWGLSKDLGLAGLCTAFIHSWSQPFIHKAKTLCYFQRLPQYHHHLVATLLEDMEWFQTEYHPTNIARLANRYKDCVERLQKMQATVRDGAAGLFVWVNLSKFLEAQTVEAELALAQRLVCGGVYIRPGVQFGETRVGWFRLIFAVPEDQYQLGLERLAKILNDEI